MLIRIDPTSDRAIYAQIADAVRGAVAAGRVRAGEVLPPARELATGLGVNAHTVLHAYQLLRDEGLVDLRRGRGATITQAAVAMTELHREALVLARLAHTHRVGAEALGAIVAEALAAIDTGTDHHEKGQL